MTIILSFLNTRLYDDFIISEESTSDGQKNFVFNANLSDEGKQFYCRVTYAEGIHFDSDKIPLTVNPAIG